MNIRSGRSHGRSRGFTLPEIIVTVTLIAILASVVVPAIVSQVKKGDPARMGSDYLAIRGGTEQFLSDVRRYPASISQLTNAITATTMSPLTGTSVAPYGVAEQNRWRGPYLNKDGSAALLTGFGLSFANAFEVDQLDVSGTTSSSGATQKYMVLALSGTSLDTAGLNDFDRQFDDGVPTTGSIRSTTSKLLLLLMPIY
ncbi:MAG TPA: prepilin-type N-terminal cleavage/methylation domain-containing protein [Gemmatimonadaceae bacterium]|jgi:prepilin-type N-terminal cleavage/methylation domain-containing protein